ncbi:MAG: aminotransferase class I/II-fold pyridoxal phosphate-dependent enzyme [Thermoplasmatales archaeon]
MDHGGARADELGLIDFSYSANPYVPPFLKEAVVSSKLDRYPYCESLLEERIKTKFSIKGDVAIAAGITEQIYIIFNIFRKWRFVIPKFTYSEYERVAKIVGAKYRSIRKRSLTIDDLKLQRGEVLIINNPNNPTGKYYDFLSDVIEGATSREYYVVVDEAFIDFVRQRSKDIEINDNVVLMRSFSKSYNVSGIRIGYAIASEQTARKIRETRMPWGIGSLGCSVIENIVSDENFLKGSLAKIFGERDRIMKITGLKTDANFFLGRVGEAEITKEKLKMRGILVRDCTSFGFPDSIRFSIRKKKDNDILLESLEGIDISLPEGIWF